MRIVSTGSQGHSLIFDQGKSYSFLKANALIEEKSKGPPLATKTLFEWI